MSNLHSSSVNRLAKQIVYRHASVVICTEERGSSFFGLAPSAMA
jgi:hypothetical protein